METGGTENMLIDIINEQIKTNEIELLIINDKINYSLLDKVHRNVKIGLIGRAKSSINIFKLIYFNYLVIRSNADILHFHNHNAVNILFFRCFFKKVLTVHGTQYSLKNFYKYERIISISKSMRSFIYHKIRIRSTLIYNGIDFQNILKKVEWHSKKDFNIIQIGRLNHSEKAQDLLIKAVGILVNKYKLYNIKLTFIGDGESKEFLVNLVKELNIEENVTFLGNRTRKYIYQNLKSYDLLVQPSNFEGFGLSIVEALAARVPTLVSNLNGPMEIIDEGRFGFFFKRGDEEDCSNKILHIMTNLTEFQKEKIVSEALEFANLNFNIINTSASYIEEYKNVLYQNNDF